MWSGPRNISTAMMRSWGNRDDCFVCDEPLYAHYLQHTRLEHPGADEIVAHHEADWRKVVDWLTGEIPEGRRIFYQKQMTHHLLPQIGRDWLDSLTHVFLIREPREMITSYLVRRETMQLEDTGLPQQLEIFERVTRRLGQAPPVIDSRDILENPAGMLGKLCKRLGVRYTDAMLSWAPGKRPTDGVWAKHWYTAVERSTGFEPYRPRNVTLPEGLAGLADRCDELYRRLHEHRIVSD